MKRTGVWMVIIFCLAISWMLEAGHGVLEEILLESASRGNHERIKKILALDLSVDINAKNKKGETALYMAARSGMIETVKVLIRKGADPDIQNKAGHTPLLAALRTSSTSSEYMFRISQVARFLIMKGTSLSFRDPYNRTYLMIASESGRESVITCLLSQPDIEIDGRDRQGLTALMFAVRSKKYETAKALVAAGAKLYLRDNLGKTALHYAAISADITAMLLDQGAPIEATDRRGFTPMMQAVEYGNPDAVRVLLKRGADLDAMDFGGNLTPLILAINKRDIDLVSLLLTSGADVKRTDKRKQAPIHIAAAGGFTRIVALLLDHGSPVDVKNCQGVTPLMSACEYGHNDLVRLLLKRGADIEATSKCGWSPLFYAVFYGHHDVSRLLIDSGADTSRRDPNGRTPVDLARERRFERIVKLLI